MCGIAGYIDKSGEFKTSYELIRKMTDKMRHRGPDAQGHWIDEKVALGHRRLSIIDPDSKSNQPLFSADGRFVITYNGEIYNYIELKNELARRGAVFHTNSDTEVIIEAYRAYGTECFNLFNGMWAFALYDTADQKVVLCRDRFGIKPLYIVDNDEVFMFASELKAIIEALPAENIQNDAWIYHYLTRSRIEDSDGECIYKNIRIFPHAQYMIYDLTRNRSEISEYWKVDPEKFDRKWIQGSDPIRTFKELFDSAVGLRLRADVEVGACLSGGLDSSAIVGCVSKKYGRKIHTFSAIYKDADCNEEDYIQKVNEKWNTISHYIMPDNYENDLIRQIEELTYYHEQPSIDMSLFSQYSVMRAAQGNVKVLLDGQGADEMFAGYHAYYLCHMDDLADKNTFESRRQAIMICAYLKKRLPDIMNLVSTDTLVRVAGMKNSFELQMTNGVEDQKLKISVPVFTENFLGKVHESSPQTPRYGLSSLNERLCRDIMSDSIPCLLHNEDGNSMAFSIESRVPFLDYRLVEFAIALDGTYKIRNGETKWIVRKACRNYLPEKVARRRDKMGFPAPFARWLRESKSSADIAKIIYEFGDRDIVSRDRIDQLYKAHMNMQADYNSILFKFLSLELWMRMRSK